MMSFSITFCGGALVIMMRHNIRSESLFIISGSKITFPKIMCCGLSDMSISLLYGRLCAGSKPCLTPFCVFLP